jgi:hypothetical protein
MESWIEVIQTLGFPIAVCVACGLFIYKLWQQSVEREKVLMEEISENRKINQQFAEIIGQYEITLGEIRTDIHDIKNTLQIE